MSSAGRRCDSDTQSHISQPRDSSPERKLLLEERSERLCVMIATFMVNPGKHEYTTKSP